jgi:hypothetical protein
MKKNSPPFWSSHYRFLKQGLKGWEVVPEEVAREKASQCLRDTVLTASKLGEQAKVPRGGTSADELLNGVELEEAKSFVRASVAVLTGQATGMDGNMLETKRIETPLKRPRSYPNGNSEVEQQDHPKRPRQCASLSKLDNTTFGGYSNIKHSVSTLLMHKLPLGDARQEQRTAEVEFLTSNYSLGTSNIWGSSYPGIHPVNVPSDGEYACVKQAILRAEQLKDDDSAFQRLIDGLLREQ